MAAVDLELNDDQELLREATERFVQTACPLTRVRELGESGADIGDGYVRPAAELGWFAMLVPEELGGGSVSGSGMLDAVVLAEERGRFLQPVAFAATNVVADTLVRVGSAEQREAALPAIVAGEARAAWALADDTGDWGVSSGIEVTAKNGDLVLRGTSILVQDADVADWVLATAADTGSVPERRAGSVPERGAASVTQVLVPAGAPGVGVTRRAGLDLSRRWCEIRFDDVTLPSSAVVGTAGAGARDVERQLDVAAVLTVAESVGAMDEIFETTVDYAKVRTAFGRPIGSFQAVKHLLADTSLLVEQSKAIAVAAAQAVQEERSNASEIASMAKAFVGEAGIDVAQNCWQVFGGIAYTWEHDLHLYLRRLTADASLYGEPSWHRERICRIHGL